MNKTSKSWSIFCYFTWYLNIPQNSEASLCISVISRWQIAIPSALWVLWQISSSLWMSWYLSQKFLLLSFKSFLSLSLNTPIVVLPWRLSWPSTILGLMMNSENSMCSPGSVVTGLMIAGSSPVISRCSMSRAFSFTRGNRLRLYEVLHSEQLNKRFCQSYASQ